jgi:tetratricopeptide (TPR) repeat protein
MDAQEYFNRANEFFNQNDFDRAIADYTESLRLQPDMEAAKNNLSNAYFNRGLASFRKGDSNRAIADLTEAAALNPNDVQIYGARGTINNQVGNHDGVINDFTEVIRLEPTVMAYITRSGAYHEKSNASLAAGDNNSYFKYKDLQIKDNEAALQIDPADKNLQKMLELTISEREHRKQTCEYLEKGILS